MRRRDFTDLFLLYTSTAHLDSRAYVVLRSPLVRALILLRQPLRTVLDEAL